MASGSAGCVCPRSNPTGVRHTASAKPSSTRPNRLKSRWVRIGVLLIIGNVVITETEPVLRAELAQVVDHVPRLGHGSGRGPQVSARRDRELRHGHGGPAGGNIYIW